jgi:hypothetical protein
VEATGLDKMRRRRATLIASRYFVVGGGGGGGEGAGFDVVFKSMRRAMMPPLGSFLVSKSRTKGLLVVFVFFVLLES